jgi:hypothetical protein
VRENLGIQDGCAFECSSEFMCIADGKDIPKPNLRQVSNAIGLITLPCGCTSAARVVTKTIKECPTRTSCINCSTGYGGWTVTATNCPKETLQPLIPLP